MSNKLMIALALFGVVVWVSCAALRGLRAPTPEPTEIAPRVIKASFGYVAVYAIRTGWVSVKESHRTLSGLDTFRIPGILLDQTWTEWMPVTVFVIVHPEGVWLVDAGLSEETLSSKDSHCDPGNHFVYQNLLRFRFAPEDRIDRQLTSLGLDLSSIKGVILTHRHADHTDALPYLPKAATVYVGEGDWPTHNGALSCRWPQEREPTLIGASGEPFGAFPHATPLTKDKKLQIVPIVGHSPGHLGVMLETNAKTLLFAGDSAFSIEQVETNTIAGISEVPDAARESLRLIQRQRQQAPTSLLPTHDQASLLQFWREYGR
jgi:N-acyl homoserine lactone hydrolase